MNRFSFSTDPGCSLTSPDFWLLPFWIPFEFLGETGRLYTVNFPVKSQPAWSAGSLPLPDSLWGTCNSWFFGSESWLGAGCGSDSSGILTPDLSPHTSPLVSCGFPCPGLTVLSHLSKPSLSAHHSPALGHAAADKKLAAESSQLGGLAGRYCRAQWDPHILGPEEVTSQLSPEKW